MSELAEPGPSQELSDGDLPVPTPKEQTVDRILDAAYDCLLESGYSSRLHAAIAERSGYSRPTVYKYLGDQSAIIAALVRREFARYFQLAQSAGHSMNASPREGFVNGIVFGVQYCRRHELLQHALRENPEQVLPYLTTHAEPLMQLCIDSLTPRVKDLVAAGVLSPEADPVLHIEWMFRLSASLVLTPSTREIPDTDSLRRYVYDMLSIGAAAPPTQQEP